MAKGWACWMMFMLVLAIGPPEGFTQDFEPQHIHKTGRLSFESPPDAVFALLIPQGQQSLAPSWDIEHLSPPSGDVVPGATFTKTHRHAGVQQVWTVVEVDAPRRLTYAIFVAGLETWVFQMDLRSDGQGKTRVDVTHTITSLSAEANPAVQEFADTFASYLDSWGAAIRRALKRGK